MKPKSHITLLGCEQCGKVFKGRAYPHKGSDIIGYTDKICGPVCKAARQAEKIETITCYCGTVFTAYKSLNRKTCSKPCATTAKWVRYRDNKSKPEKQNEEETNQ